MSRAYKNFWSLNIDEAIVAGILRSDTSMEVLMPLNAQLKNIDLIIADINANRYITLQIKGSRAYEPKKNEVRDYGHGSAGWFFFDKDKIEKSSADYFIFLIYVIEESQEIGRRTLSPHTVTIPTKELNKLVTKNKKVDQKGRYNFLIWINPENKEAFDFRDTKYDLSKYLDIKGLAQLQE